eukprot:scaffold22361_cov103-Phaeocystis_antarctica.AAC.4
MVASRPRTAQRPPGQRHWPCPDRGDRSGAELNSGVLRRGEGMTAQGNDVREIVPRPRSSAPAPAAQRVSEHRGQDKQLPARSEAPHQSEG